MAIATINPATGEVVKRFDALTDAQVDDKITTADAAFHRFRKTPFADRARWMTKAAEILASEKEAIGRLMTLEMGKTFPSAIAEGKVLPISRVMRRPMASFSDARISAALVIQRARSAKGVLRKR